MQNRNLTHQRKLTKNTKKNLRRKKPLAERLEDRHLLTGSPGIEIEKLTNGFSADAPADAIGIAPGESVEWTYLVTNSGNTTYDRHEIVVSDDNGTPGSTSDDLGTVNGTINLETSSDSGGDSKLSPGETWVFKAQGIAADVSTSVMTMIEAEDMHRSGFWKVYGSNASNHHLVKLQHFGGSGSLTKTFRGTSGIYKTTLLVQDENDGESVLNVKVNGQPVGSVLLDRNSDGVGHNNGQFSAFVLDDIAINHGDEIAIETTGNGHELVRIDKLTFEKPADGFYKNVGTVTAGSESASDDGYYVSPSPGVSLVKFTNGEDANTNESAAEIAPGDTVTWTYEVTNTGNVPVPTAQVYVVDDNGTPGHPGDDFDTNSAISLISSPATADGVLGPGETWTYTASNVAQDLSFANALTVEAETLHRAGFSVIHNAHVSGGALVKLTDAGTSGSLTGQFDGPSDVYQVKFFVQDESDGQSSAQVLIGGVEVLAGLLDQDTDGTGNDSGPFSEFVIDNVAINSGDDIVINVTGDQGEFFRFDKIEFTGSDLVGFYRNVAQVSTGPATASDPSTYTNSDPNQPQLAKLGDFVFFDLDGDGVQDPGEQGVPDVTVTLTGGGPDGVIGTADDTTDDKKTSSTGLYRFNDLNPGEEYKLTFSDLPAGFEFTQSGAGSDSASDSDADPNTGMSPIVVLAADQVNLDIDAGLVSTGPPAPTARLGNKVFLDANKNGKQDPGEPGIGKIQVTLTGGGADGVIGTGGDDTTETKQTTRIGRYLFEDLNPGEEYKVTFELPDGYEFTAANAAGDKLDSDADPVTGMSPIIILEDDELDLSVDAGLIALPAQLGDRVWNDANGNGAYDRGEKGVKDVTVTLTGGGPDGVIGTADDTTATDTTTRSGRYRFTDLNPFEEYKLTFTDIPAGLIFTQKNATVVNRDSDVNPSTGMTDIVVLQPGQTKLNVDAGLKTPPVPETSLGNRVFLDVNGDGRANEGEPGVQGVKVTLTGGGADGVIGTGGDDTMEMRFTNNNGFYNFMNLNPGEEYKVTFSELPDGFMFTTQDAGGNDANDSDADPVTGMSPVVVLALGENNNAVDAGIVQKTASLGDKVFLDINRNGLQDSGEPGVEAVKVTLTGGGADGVIGTADDTSEMTDTDSMGMYSFGGLNPGEEYKVTFSHLPAGFNFTHANVNNNGDDTIDSDADQHTGMTQIVTLSADEDNVTLDAGLVDNRPKTHAPRSCEVQIGGHPGGRVEVHYNHQSDVADKYLLFDQNGNLVDTVFANDTSDQGYVHEWEWWLIFPKLVHRYELDWLGQDYGFDPNHVFSVSAMNDGERASDPISCHR